MKLVGRGTLFAVFCVATSASAIVISGGAADPPPGGGTCTVTTNATCNGTSAAAPDCGTVTVTCSGLNLSATRHLYWGINNAPSGANAPNGDSMFFSSPLPAYNEVFRFSSSATNSLTYSATTRVYWPNTPFPGTRDVNLLNVVTFGSGTGTMVCDSRTAALDSAPNGDVRCVWQVSSTSFTTTVNVRGALAPTTPTTSAAPTIFDQSHASPSNRETDHVNLAFYWDTCGNGVREGDEQCDSGASNGTAGDCCDTNCNFVASGTVCRSAAGSCDVQETCTGTSGSCPADAVLSSSTVCRSSAGACDAAAEHCTGLSVDCPADVLEPASTVCRSAAGDCDVAENCTGTSPDCPTDAFEPSTLVCRSSAGVCDVAENCTGTSASCPADGFFPYTTECRAAAGMCDQEENCTGSEPDCPPDFKEPDGVPCLDEFPANPCTVDQCDGINDACQHFAGNAGVECRPSTGVCDVPESCTGTDPDCPADAYVPSTVLCRSSAGDCDVAEYCPGASGDCYGNSFAAASVECRAAAGPCDQAEHCTGTTATCPADQKSTAVCRAAAGACDVAESCDGASDTCPADALAPSGTVCRAAANSCDVAETCDGSSTACPGDAVKPDGTACDDNNGCTSPDACQGGVCVGTPPANGCADHYLCYKVKPQTAFVAVPDVHLVDQFEDIHAAVQKVKHLCTPADKNGEGITDDVTHLESYTIKAVSGTPKLVRRTNLKIDNQLGTLQVDAYKRDLLLVPANKSLSGPTSPPNIGAINVDHYKCYKVKLTAGQSFVPTTVNVADQFNNQPKSFVLKKIKHLCTPVDKNGEGIKNADGHLACYQAKPASGQPKHARRTGVNTADQLGALVLGTIKESELCIPSVKTLP